MVRREVTYLMDCGTNGEKFQKPDRHTNEEIYVHIRQFMLVRKGVNSLAPQTGCGTGNQFSGSGLVPTI